ncbi:hypothetical protein M3N64_04960 [Sporolactobacillus sp. CPB3-1]|uniref:YwgA family protein n=1 Tax=Sporolactobacillus mangiferae TaxID=2940498 RepID=A0ABT0M8U8_9BACL|nr:hypothetical protein [Sporolactobacillus mangiferae]MCL1631299.1 hypothetical protein [Sporolactobacillus mangiferae]
MLEDHAKVAALIHQNGETIGRKKLQKAIYIFQKLGYPFHQIFHFHFRGPYSEELSVQLEELCDFGFLIEDRENEEQTDDPCVYRISEAGRDFLSHYKDVLPNVSRLMQCVVGQSIHFLECVTILLYFDHLSHDAAIEKVLVLEKEITSSELTRALAFIEEICRLQSIESPASR